MAKTTRSSWEGFLLRLGLALVVVFSTFNPEGLSYVHGALVPPSDLLVNFSVLKGLVGVALLIAWTILWRATLGSLGAFGVLLALLFLGLLILLLFELLGLPPTNLRVGTNILELMLAGLLSAGVSWPRVGRRLSGQPERDGPGD